MAELITDYLIQTATIGMLDALFGRLHRGKTGEVTGGTLRVYILSVLEGAIQAGDQGYVPGVIGQRLHR